MEEFKKLLPYLLVNIIAFYLLPLVINNTGMAMVILLAGIPLICFINSLIFGLRHSFSLIYVLTTALIFIPTIFIYYNDSALIYVIVYAIIALIGNFIGKIVNDKLL